METRRMLAVMVVLCAACGVLVTAASSLGAARPDQETTGAAPRSSLAADYSPDTGIRRTAPISSELLAAAARDARALGRWPGSLIVDAGNAGSSGGGAGPITGVASDDPALPPDTRQPAAERGLESFPTSIPVVPSLIAMAAVVLVVMTAYLALRPARD